MTPAEQRALDHIEAAESNGRHVDIFWVTENQSRAKAIDALQKRGVITQDLKHKHGGYPVCVFNVNKEKANARK